MIAGEVEPPTTRKDIMIRFRNGSVGLNNTCSWVPPTSPMLNHSHYFSNGHGYPLRYTGIKDGVTLRGQGTHENGGRENRETRNESSDKMRI